MLFKILPVPPPKKNTNILKCVKKFKKIPPSCYITITVLLQSIVVWEQLILLKHWIRNNNSYSFDLNLVSIEQKYPVICQRWQVLLDFSRFVSFIYVAG